MQSPSPRTSWTRRGEAARLLLITVLAWVVPGVVFKLIQMFTQ